MRASPETWGARTTRRAHPPTSVASGYNPLVAPSAGGAQTSWGRHHQLHPGNVGAHRPDDVTAQPVVLAVDVVGAVGILIDPRTTLPPQDNTQLEALLHQLLEKATTAVLEAPNGHRVALPPEIFVVLLDITRALADGCAITIAPHEQLLSTCKPPTCWGSADPPWWPSSSGKSCPTRSPGATATRTWTASPSMPTSSASATPPPPYDGSKARHRRASHSAARRQRLNPLHPHPSPRTVLTHRPRTIRGESGLSRRGRRGRRRGGWWPRSRGRSWRAGR